MPIVWRYLLRSYFQVFILCVSSFIGVLLVIRIQEIARFASSGAPIKIVFLFALYQIPYILPIAIPISCLISAILLFQKLSHTHELTAFRTCGIGFAPLTFPLLVAGALLSLCSFTIVSEIAPRCRALSKELVYEITAVNPLFLLQKDTLLKLKDAYIDMKILKSGKYAKDVIVVVRNLSNERLGLILAKELALNEERLTGNNVAFISSLDSKRPDSFDHLVIENQSNMSTKASIFSEFMQNTAWLANYDYLTLKMLLVRRSIENSPLKIGYGRADQEIARRFSLALASFTFTLIGTSFGTEIGRRHSKKGIIGAIAFSSLFLVSFIAAKSMHTSPLISCILYLAMHPLIIFLCLRSVRRVSKGVE